MLASVGHRYTFGCFSGSFTCVHRSNLPVPGVATDPHLRLGLPARPGFISPASARRCHRLTVGSFGLHDTSSWWDLNPHRIYSYGDFHCLPPSVIASYFRAGTSRTLESMSLLPGSTSPSEPCVRLSPHTAPGGSTLFSVASAMFIHVATSVHHHHILDVIIPMVSVTVMQMYFIRLHEVMSTCRTFAVLKL